jgi:hypothetical protein
VRQLILFLVSAVMMLSCKKNDCTPAKYGYTFSENKQIDTVRYGGYELSTQVNPGSNIVFSYSVLGRYCPNWTDGPSFEGLVFEIPAGATNFNYSGTDLQRIECYYEYSSWGGGDVIRATQGTLRGNRVSEEKWNVEVDLIIPVRGELIFTKQFKIQ